MIVICSGCQTKYRLDEHAVRGGRVLLLCPECRTWFSVAVTPGRAPAPPSAEVVAAPLKLLIADEPNGLRHRIIEALGQLEPGLEVVVVDNGAEAVRALGDLTPDLAIIGTGIEQTYCFEVCDFMRADERLRNARIIFASELNPRAWDCGDPKSLHGADAWLSNAVSNDELLKSLRGHLEAVRPGPPAPAP